MNAQDTAQELSSLLPDVIDKLSPGGKVPNDGELGGLLSSVRNMLG